jgi:hypothetical protein
MLKFLFRELMEVTESLNAISELSPLLRTNKAPLMQLNLKNIFQRMNQLNLPMVRLKNLLNSSWLTSKSLRLTQGKLQEVDQMNWVQMKMKSIMAKGSRSSLIRQNQMVSKSQRKIAAQLS